MGIEKQVVRLRHEIQMIRDQREITSAVHSASSQKTQLQIHQRRAKIAKLLRKGHDASLYNHAIQQLYKEEGQVMPQQYVMLQSKVMQMMHKTVMIQRQIPTIEQLSNEGVNSMMGEAAVIEGEKEGLEKDVMTQQGEFMNSSFELERKLHLEIQAQKMVLTHLKCVLKPEEMCVDSKNHDSQSTTTMESCEESGSEGFLSDDESRELQKLSLSQHGQQPNSNLMATFSRFLVF